LLQDGSSTFVADFRQEAVLGRISVDFLRE
jgi:hypothetical protein